MLISKRMAKLLEKAAACFDQGTNPFRDPEWLADNNPSPAECEQLAGLIGAVLHQFAEPMDKTPIEGLRLSGGRGDIAKETLRVVIDHRGMLKRSESANPPASST
jgi:hypothetical protein